MLGTRLARKWEQNQYFCRHTFISEPAWFLICLRFIRPIIVNIFSLNRYLFSLCKDPPNFYWGEGGSVHRQEPIWWAPDTGYYLFYFYLVTDEEQQCGNPVNKQITYLLTYCKSITTNGLHVDWILVWSNFSVVCYTAVFSIVTQRGALRDDTKNGCVAD